MLVKYIINYKTNFLKNVNHFQNSISTLINLKVLTKL